MRKALNYFLICLVFITVNTCHLFAQSDVSAALAILKNINETYRGKENFVIELSYVMDRLDNGKMLDNLNGTFKKKGEKVHFKLADFETACEGEFNISVDNFTKTIFISDPVVFDPLNLTDLKQDIADQVFASAEIAETGKNEKQITLSMKIGGIQKVEVKYSTETLYLKKVTTWYSRPYQLGNESYPVKITVTYLKHNENGEVKAEDFPSAKYITQKNNNFILKPAYSSYRLFDKTTKTGNL